MVRICEREMRAVCISLYSAGKLERLFWNGGLEQASVCVGHLERGKVVCSVSRVNSVFLWIQVM